MRLKDKVVLITGAAGAIGIAAVKRFSEEGAKVMLADVNLESLQPLVAQLGADRAACVAVDVTQPDQVENMVRACTDAFGGIDVFVANAGIEGKIGEIIDSDVANLDKVLAVNVRGVWLGLHYVIPVMKNGGGGSIIITSSGAGVKGAANMVPYNTSKHAVIGMMRCAALECTQYNIRVNTVNPGPIESRMMRSIAEGFAPGGGDDFNQKITAQTPMGRYGQPVEIANMMVFLGSDESSYCTGSVYMVDGGNAT
ncbi:MAG: SDR family oxidoreductase [Gammaproteobacteria bacterium]|uniref:SDR family NAD(P)-dependent oxidoreductase n=1 Tax=Pseudomaricurvus alcaniphilus TaxID=1166482 RepID=UPI001407DC49|nr:SDR family oxidoreductase [Pseudomaricurvus alcaniphilus]MBR9911800.1 SDR family oxidoreductase [Gammaproteobacteria bacterium]NHN39229.1 SDR family oxidoreductase [Pseudomaricurvus alcaniphilus]